MAELLAVLPGTAYSVRRSLHDARHINQAKKAIRIAFEAQVRGLGFSLVELLSSCPTNWGMTPAEALEWVESDMMPAYPLGDYKVADGLGDLSK
jgi:2-oxoglutarate ferredoxin oxidoreductase subunit beta